MPALEGMFRRRGGVAVPDQLEEQQVVASSISADGQSGASGLGSGDNGNSVFNVGSLWQRDGKLKQQLRNLVGGCKCMTLPRPTTILAQLEILSSRQGSQRAVVSG
jgi:hypothetical protein